MHTALGTTRELIEQNIQDFADAARHGNWNEAPSTNSAQRWKMLSVSRDILVKYMDYAEPVLSAELAQIPRTD